MLNYFSTDIGIAHTISSVPLGNVSELYVRNESRKNEFPFGNCYLKIVECRRNESRKNGPYLHFLSVRLFGHVYRTVRPNCSAERSAEPECSLVHCSISRHL